MPLIEPGRKAPDFALPDQSGAVHRLKDYRGKAVVLFFYPKDDTEDCTKEACSFTDSRAALARAGAVVLGISRHDVKSKAKFARKHSIEIPLLADESTEVSAKYGVLREKSMYGKKYMGIDRTTFLIDPAGKVLRRWDDVEVDGHTEKVLAEIAGQRGAKPARAPATRTSSVKKR